MYMQKNTDVKNVKEYLKKVDIYIKNYNIIYTKITIITYNIHIK